MMKDAQSLISASDLVRRARVSQGYSQAEFGAQIGRSQGVVSKYEAGTVDPPGEVLIHCMNVLAEKERREEDLGSRFAAIRSALDTLTHAIHALQPSGGRGTADNP